MLTVRLSRDGGRTWPLGIGLGDAMTDYSSLVEGELAAAPGFGGVLFGSCKHPVPYRLWCLPIDSVKALHKTWWTVLFTRFPLPA